MMQVGGVLAAVLSSALGGTAVGATRYLAGVLDPVSIGAVRFAGGFLILLPIALWLRERWPERSDWPGAVTLGLLLFGLFPALFNAALTFTTAARGALALSTLPLLTMAAGAVLNVEPLSPRKTSGVLIAMGGVTVALTAGLSAAPPGAWRGDALMVAAALCMALYNVLSRPLIGRSGPLSFAAFGMGVGALGLAILSGLEGGAERIPALGAPHLVALAYLAVVCGALVFFLWAYALGRTLPTLVSVSVAVNPITASLFGILLLGERIGANLIVGLVTVLFGIAIASSAPRRANST